MATSYAFSRAGRLSVMRATWPSSISSYRTAGSAAGMSGIGIDQDRQLNRSTATAASFSSIAWPSSAGRRRGPAC